MAAKGTSPELIQKWMDQLSDSRNRLEEARAKTDEAYASHCADIRGAFAAGLSVVPIREATGKTSSRLYQIKGGRRT